VISALLQILPQSRLAKRPMLYSDHRYASQAIESMVLATTQRSPATTTRTRLSAPSTHFVPSASSFVLLQLSLCHAPSPAHGYPYYNTFFRGLSRPALTSQRTADASQRTAPASQRTMTTSQRTAERQEILQQTRFVWRRCLEMARRNYVNPSERVFENRECGGVHSTR
jgi:hypothetical protein